MRWIVALSLGLVVTGWGGAAFSQTPQPPEPMSDQFDWVQFKNGEWLKGDIKDLQDDKFQFDSDELDSLNMDWNDIYALYSPRYNTCIFEDRRVIQGRIRIEGDKLVLLTAEGEQAFSRSFLRTIIPGELKERNFWSFKWSLGMTSRQGNTQQDDVSTLLFIQRRSTRARTQFDLASNYSNVEGEETANNHNATFTHDLYMTRRLYATVPSVQYYRDRFQNIADRVTPGLGLGYEIIDRGKIEWSAGGGFGYQSARYATVEAGENKREETSVLTATTAFHYDITKRIEFDLQYNTSFGITGRRSNDHHALVMWSFELWSDLDFDISLTWDRIGNPKAREDGTVPKNDDLRTFIGIGWEF